MKITTILKASIAATSLMGGMPAMAEGIKVGHLTYHTGEYGAWGEFFDGVADFAISVVNQDPPLGREFVTIHQDIGTIGEAMAARKLLDSENVDILLNPAHSYLSYRDYAIDRVAQNQGPLMPSVHGGAIEAEYGGTGEEPIFRGSPMDSAQATAAILHAHQAGKTSVVLIATEVAGSQLQKEAAEKVAASLGIDVLLSVDIQPGQPNYRSVVSRVAREKPEAVIVFSAPADGGAIVKNAAESGEAWFVVGTSEWQEEEFANTATVGAIAQHEEVVFAAFAPQEGEAWDYYEPLASASPQAEAIGDVANSYAIQYYDLIVATALAIELAGTTDAGPWASAMYEVTGGDGEIVHTYAEGIEALRAGKPINYDGVTGSMEYTNTGVVAGLFGIFEWGDDGLNMVASVDGNKVLELEQLN
ncbi:ABC transporter substrate-binding protein [Phaeobacter italicus]|jgi:ABC-type branched-subunit amino acid transport system substrate-binding protein|uniref:ABC transporter substrate-binding protein n=1 Tax=Phaeobacter italicus TaxID=481446 RepID=UPI002FDB8BAB